MAKKLVALLLAVAMVMSFALIAHAEEDDFVDGKFTTTHHITVELYDRGTVSDVTANVYADYIRQGMLEKYNVEVEFVKVPRWTETEELNNLLAAQTAPDVCVTYSYPTIQAYADMDGVTDLAPLLEEYKDLLPNLWSLLGDYNIYYDQDPDTGTLWAIEALLKENERIVTFIRQDWLDALGLETPTTTEEFEAVLYAFKERADELPVDDPSKVVPYSISYDVGWRAATLIESFIGEVSDRDYFVNGYDDRKLTQNGTKEAVRLLNKWYNDGLLWDNFALYQSDTTVEDDNMKAGYVGAFTHNYDYAFRNGTDSINANLKRNVGEDAKFVAIDPFTDSNGNYTKYMSDRVDRKVFFPATNDEPLASLLYLDFISDLETIEYLQIGEEGITHEVIEDGIIQAITLDSSDERYNTYAIVNKNIDYTITNNGLNLTDADVTNKSRAYAYGEGGEVEDIVHAIECAQTDAIVPAKVSVGSIEAEANVGDTLSSKRNQVYNQAVVCSVEDFDAVWDEFYEEYMAAGGRDIQEERAEKWAAYYGDADMLPE